MFGPLTIAYNDSLIFPPSPIFDMTHYRESPLCSKKIALTFKLSKVLVTETRLLKAVNCTACSFDYLSVQLWSFHKINTKRVLNFIRLLKKLAETHKGSKGEAL